MLKLFMRLLLLILLFHTVHASTMYTLSGIQTAYSVVELQGAPLPKTMQSELKKMLNETLDELNISHDNYDPRAFALIITSKAIDSKYYITFSLLIGEQVSRIGSSEPLFAKTYEQKSDLVYRADEAIEEVIEDRVSEMLFKFANQYQSENKKRPSAPLNDSPLTHQGYESHYAKALARAKKEQKPIMMVITANFCPWCKKFEHRVLRQSALHEKIVTNFIPLLINREKEPFPKRFDKAFTPTIQFISPQEKLLKTVVGYNNRDEFIYFINHYTP